MQGCGNDYIFFDCREKEIPDPSSLSIRLSDRRFGIGGDGIVLILPSRNADVKMRIFNSDGSEGNVCGTALRCIGKILFDEEIRKSYSVETKAGVKRVTACDDGRFTVDMGVPSFLPKSIPALFPTKIVDVPFFGHKITCVSMGNPHVILFEEPNGFPLLEVAEKIRNSGYFPDGANVESAIVEKDVIRARVVERGSGETLSCGSGACAIAVSAYETGRAGKESFISFPGGIVQVNLTENGVLLTGDAVKVFTGEIDI